jgi:hypothetical protein
VTVDRFQELQKLMDSGEATSAQKDEWLRLSVSEHTRRYPELIEAATRYLEDRVSAILPERLLAEAPQLWADVKRAWGWQAARAAWKRAAPRRKHGRTEWNRILPPRGRGRPLSDEQFYSDATTANRVDLKLHQAERDSVKMSADDAIDEVIDGKQDPSREMRRIKNRLARRRTDTG